MAGDGSDLHEATGDMLRRQQQAKLASLTAGVRLAYLTVCLKALEAGEMSPVNFNRHTGMVYAEAVQSWYRLSLAMAAQGIRDQQARGLLSLDECAAILEVAGQAV